MNKNQLNRLYIFFLVLGTFLIYQPIFSTFSSNLLEVTFFDVGEGDSIMISSPSFQGVFNRVQILIDGGPSRDIVEKVAREMSFFDRQIELIILTHPDKDHIGGLFEILETFKVEKILMPKIKGSNEEKEILTSFEKLILEKGIKIYFAKEGQQILLPDKSTFWIFWPPEDFISEYTNDFSIICKFSFGKIDFLFTGDAPKKVEYQLLTKNFNLESEIFKIAHHGSKNSTSEYFLRKVSPEVAIISVGKNHYGHPSKGVLDLILKYDIKLLRTDKNGDIKIFSDGQRYEIK